jgi:aspartate aminotransferase-like enzyme
MSSKLPDAASGFEDLNPSPRLLMGPGPVNVDPRVLRAISMPLLGQFDPEFTAYMNETMALLRRLFQTENRWSFLIDGTARAGIEALLVSIIEPGDKVLVPIFGRFGHLLHEITVRCGAEVATLETEWGTVFPPEAIEDAVKTHRPKLVALVHGDTSAGAMTACSMWMPRPHWAAWISRSTLGTSTPPQPACKSVCRVRQVPRPSLSTNASSAPC